jgi:hypothetical protein
MIFRFHHTGSSDARTVGCLASSLVRIQDGPEAERSDLIKYEKYGYIMYKGQGKKLGEALLSATIRSRTF